MIRWWTLLFVGSVVSFNVSAEGFMMGGMQHRHPKSFTSDEVRTDADGQVMKKHIVQTVSPGNLIRTIKVTNAKGQIMTKIVSWHRDTQQHSWTHSVEVTGFNGKHFEMHAEGHGDMSGDLKEMPEDPGQAMGKQM